MRRGESRGAASRGSRGWDRRALERSEEERARVAHVEEVLGAALELDLHPAADAAPADDARAAKSNLTQRLGHVVWLACGLADSVRGELRAGIIPA